MVKSTQRVLHGRLPHVSIVLCYLHEVINNMRSIKCC